MSDTIDVDFWKKELNAFTQKRGWDSCHNPKNLAMDLIGESAELMEIFKWMSPEESAQVSKDPQKLEHIQQEMGDVLISLILLAEKLNINLSKALSDKIELTATQYPIV